MAKKGSEQPIWLLVALLLAVVVGIAMFQMIGKGTNIFSPFMKEPGEAEKSQMRTFCESWIRPTETDINGNINPLSSQPSQSRLDEMTDVFRKGNWLISDKDTNNAYLEAPPVSGCDCVLFLTSTVGGSSLTPTRARVFLEAQNAAGSLIYSSASCHYTATCVGKAITELGGLFSDKSYKAC
jgi:hypothetical protein